MRRQSSGSLHSQLSPTVDGAALATIVGTPSEQATPIYKKIAIDPSDSDLREQGVSINAPIAMAIP
jgi:hypothetical protein